MNPNFAALVAAVRSPTIAGRLYRVAFGLGTLIAVLTAVALWAIAQHAALRDLSTASERAALNLDRINGLVYAVVMESRGVYMSPDIESARPYAEGITRFNNEIGKVLADWRAVVRDDDRAQFERFKTRIEQFRAFRRDLVRRASEQGPAFARALGDDANARAVRIALNEDLGALARVYAARTGEIQQRNFGTLVVSWVLVLIAGATLVLVVVGAAVVRRSVVQPLAEITNATRAVAAGQTDAQTPYADRHDEIGALASAIEVFKQTIRHNEVLNAESALAAAESAAAAVERGMMQSEIRRQKLYLDTALNHMAHGLLVADRAMRLIFCNGRYREIYRLPPEATEPGLRLDGLLRRQIKAGTFTGDIAAFIRWLGETKASAGDLELADGRIIRICTRGLDEGGWVSTHEDVTEQRRAARALGNTEKLLATLIENVPEAVVVKDARSMRYVLLNRAAETLFGVPRVEMIGKTAREVFPDSTAALVDTHDAALTPEMRSIAFTEHEIDTPGNGRRRVAARRFPIFGTAADLTFRLTLYEDRTQAAAAPVPVPAAAE